MDSPIRLACLDMAGTTVRDSGVVMAAFCAVLDAEGVTPADVRYEPMVSYVNDTMGQSKYDVFLALFEGDAAAAAHANVTFEKAYASSVRDGAIAPIDGVEDAFDRLREFGVRICLTTGFSPNTRDLIIDTLGWQDRIDLALSPADCGRGRPYPDMILSAILRLEIDDVAHVAVAGDTASDLLAAHRAGASIIAGVLTGAHDKQQLSAGPYTHIVGSAAELPDLAFGSN